MIGTAVPGLVRLGLTLLTPRSPQQGSWCGVRGSTMGLALQDILVTRQLLQLQPSHQGRKAQAPLLDMLWERGAHTPSAGSLRPKDCSEWLPGSKAPLEGQALWPRGRLPSFSLPPTGTGHPGRPWQGWGVGVGEPEDSRVVTSWAGFLQLGALCALTPLCPRRPGPRSGFPRLVTKSQSLEVKGLPPGPQTLQRPSCPTPSPGSSRQGRGAGTRGLQA